MLGQRLRRWTSIEPVLAACLVGTLISGVGHHTHCNQIHHFLLPNSGRRHPLGPRWPQLFENNHLRQINKVIISLWRWNGFGNKKRFLNKRRMQVKSLTMQNVTTSRYERGVTRRSKRGVTPTKDIVFTLQIPPFTVPYVFRKHRSTDCPANTIHRPKLAECCPTVCDAGPTFNQHWVRTPRDWLGAILVTGDWLLDSSQLLPSPSAHGATPRQRWANVADVDLLLARRWHIICCRLRTVIRRLITIKRWNFREFSNLKRPHHFRVSRRAVNA